MRCLITIAVLALIPSVAGAVAGTAESLTSERVDERIIFSIDEDLETGDKILRYLIDDDQREPVRLRSLHSFLPSRDIYFYLADFNPLKYRVATEVNAFEEPAFSAVKKFIEASLAFVETVDALARAAGADEEEARSLRGAAREAGVDTTCIAEFDALIASLKTIQELLNNGIRPAERLAQWREKANGLAGVELVLERIDSEIIDYGDRIRQIGRETRTITDLTSLRRAAANTANESDETDEAEVGTLPEECQGKMVRAIALAFNVARQYETGLRSLQAVRAALVALRDELEPFADPRRWDREEATALRFYEYLADDLQGEAVDISVTGLKVDSSALTFTESWTTQATVRLRQYASVVTEIGVGIFYTPIDIPKYGTATTDAGDVVVADGGSDRLLPQAAIFLNMIPRWGVCSWAYPVFQLGIGTGPNTPSLMVGAGVRLLGLSGLSITGGPIFTWYKDLDELTVGQPIEGTADIERDLKLQSVNDWYVALLYNFD